METGHKKGWFHNQIIYLAMLLNLLLLASCGFRNATVSNQLAKDPVHTFKQEMARLGEDLKIPGMSAAIVRNQKVIFAEGFGYADLANKIPATPATPYNIASITKTFSAAVLMKLVEQGRLNLDAELADILTDTDFPYKNNTIHGYNSVCREIRSTSKNPFLR